MATPPVGADLAGRRLPPLPKADDAVGVDPINPALDYQAVRVRLSVHFGQQAPPISPEPRALLATA